MINHELEYNDINDDLEIILEAEQYANVAIRTYTSDIAFKTIMNGIEDGLYEIPKFQRYYKWTTRQAEELATSLVRGMPIPPIYVYRGEKGVLRILDGQQRVISLYLYFKGKARKNMRRVVDFKDGIISEIVNDSSRFVNHSYNMHYYKDSNNEPLEVQTVPIDYAGLPDTTRRIVDYRSLTVVEIQVDDTKYRRNNLFKIFANLNSGGTPLLPQELRNGLYGCEFYDMLFKINETDRRWQQYYGEKNRDARDIELLLRLCAMYSRTKYDNESGMFRVEPFKKYISMLNDYSEMATSFDKKTIEMHRNLLENFINNYSIAYKESIALCEATYTVVSLFPELLNKIKEEKLRMILDSDGFRQTITSGTANIGIIEARLGVVYNELSRND